MSVSSLIPTLNFQPLIPTTISGTMTDDQDLTTDSSAVDQQFSESLKRFQILSAATREGIWEYNVLDKTSYYNDGILALLGYEREDMVDNESWWQNNLHPQDRERVMSAMDNLLASEDNIWWGEYQFLCADGTYKLILDRLFVVRDADHKPIKIIGTMQDHGQITGMRQELELIRQEQKKIMYKAVLDAEEKEKTYLSEALNENTNQILATIRMHISQARSFVSQEGSEWLQKASDMLSESISGIHNIAHQLSPASLHLLGLEDAINYLLQQLEMTMDLQCYFKVDPGVIESMDETEKINFYRIAQALIENIKKHSSASEARVYLKNKQQKKHLLVEDNGQGIDQKKIRYGRGFSTISERCENFNGSFNIKTREGVKGFAVSVII